MDQRDLTCTWCGNEVEPDDGYRLAEPSGERGAAFCRLEHVVPWAMQGAHWRPLEEIGPPAADTGTRECSHCGEPLGDAHLVLVRHRGDHRIADAFCSVDHLSGWARAGGRWQT